MSLSVSAGLSVPVKLVGVSGPAPVVLHGRVTAYDGAVYDVALNEAAPDLVLGTRIILDFPETDHDRVTATVDTVPDAGTSPTVRVREAGQSPRDKRTYPRLVAGIPLRYRVESDATAIDDWLGGRSQPTDDGSWHSPDPFMNFSVTGLRYDDAPHTQAGDLLLIELGISDGTERWRATARVIRVAPLDDPEDGGATHSVAVEFVDLPSDTQNALSDLTLNIQDALL